MILSKQLVPAALFIIAFLLLFTFNLQLANAATGCPAPAAQGGISVPHSKCVPPGSPPKGKDGTSCIPTGQVGTIEGKCLQGCCMYVSSSSADDAAKAAGLDPSSLMGGGMEKIMEMLKQLMSGGGGGGGGGGTPPEEEKEADKDNLLAIDPSLISTDDLGLDSLIFGATNTDAGTKSKEAQVNNDTGGTNDTTGTGTNDTTAPAQEGDTVETTYENLETVGNNPIVGDGVQSETFIGAGGDDVDLFGGEGDSFDADFFGANLDFSDGENNSTNGLSRLQLEAQGLLEAARLGADNETHSGSLTTPYESLTTAEIQSLQDYHSSAVAVSGSLSPFQGNPLSNEQYNSEDEDGEGSEGVGIFQRVANFFASLLGFGPPKN